MPTKRNIVLLCQISGLTGYCARADGRAHEHV